MARRGKQGNFTRPKLSSSAGLFEKRGDKWGGRNTPNPIVPPQSEADKNLERALRELNRRPVQTAKEAEARIKQAQGEDPDYDMHLRAKKAEPKPKYVDPEGTPIEASLSRKIANIRSIYRGVRRAVTRNDETSVRTIDTRVKRTPVKIAPISPKKTGVRGDYYLWVKMTDGTEIDYSNDEYKGLGKSYDDALHTFDWKRGRKDVVEVELWDGKSGDMLQRWVKPK